MPSRIGTPLSSAVDAYYRGLWNLLAFTMQMTLILVLSLILGATPFFKKIIISLSRLPRTVPQVVAGAVLTSGADLLRELGLVHRAEPDRRDSLLQAGRGEGLARRLPVPAVNARGRGGDLAIRILWQCAAPHGNAGSLPRANDGNHAAVDHDLVAGGDHHW